MLINVLHGICYAFFFATVYIFVDEFFPTDVRSSAQGLFNLMILGFGPLVANILGPKLIGETFVNGGVVDFRSLFLVPALGRAGRGRHPGRCSSTRRSEAGDERAPQIKRHGGTEIAGPHGFTLSRLARALNLRDLRVRSLNLRSSVRVKSLPVASRQELVGAVVVRQAHVGAVVAELGAGAQCGDAEQHDLGQMRGIRERAR